MESLSAKFRRRDDCSPQLRYVERLEGTVATPLRTKRSRVSAGLLMYRMRAGEVEVFIAHPGGPWFPNRDFDIWTIPKGELEAGEELFAAAVREFEEEVGKKPSGPFIDLGSIRQKGGKTVYAWGFLGDWEENTQLRTTYFSMEWPPGSGVLQEFPEVDRAGFFSIDEARHRMKVAQQPLLDRLMAALESPKP
jgi:predicted NUDIX family NTP pyrophosphohydrolase